MIANTPILTLGVTAAATLAEGQAVTAGGAIATAAGRCLGFVQTGVASGARASVTALGTAKAIASAAISVGAKLEVVGSAGKLVTATSGVVVAHALTAAGADGDWIEVLVVPN